MATRQRGSEGRQPRSEKKDHWTPTPMTLASLEKLEQRRSQNWRKLEPGSESFIHDNTSPHYSWLLPGWLAEERVVANGRVYRVSLGFFDDGVRGASFLTLCRRASIPIRPVFAFSSDYAGADEENRQKNGKAAVKWEKDDEAAEGSKLALCLLGRLWTSKKFNAFAFMTTMEKIWRLMHGMEIKDIADDIFLIQFYHWRDKEKTLEGHLERDCGAKEEDDTDIHNFTYGNRMNASPWQRLIRPSQRVKGKGGRSWHKIAGKKEYNFLSWQGGKDNVLKRLDRFVASPRWSQRFIWYKVHLPKRKSDHLPIFLEYQKQKNQKSHKRKTERPCRFEKVWLKDNACEQKIRETWNEYYAMSVGKKLGLLCRELHSTFTISTKGLGDEIREKQKRIEKLQKVQQTPQYYYDPAGNQYKTKYEILDTWEKLGVIVVDP
ncbi:hypothetical protein Cgig2_005692 [Carnegiea gigantea]|uniref:Uncharacterized protein n=1 Tax=Carnegiea gigantea TaxID=171969 RepID=A0A9Q1KF83_9CARY|nr:hypothetical protein Cgig2_005692 [Carnegiea gigantea]